MPLGCLDAWWQQEVAGPGFTHPLLPFQRKVGRAAAKPDGVLDLPVLRLETLCCSFIADLYIHD